MDDTPRLRPTQTEYEDCLVQTSKEALRRSRELLEKTKAHVSPNAAGPLIRPYSPKQREGPSLDKTKSPDR